MPSYTLTGPMFNGQAERELDDLVRDVTKDVADEGAELVRQRLKNKIQHSTGRYVSSIHVVRANAMSTITDAKQAWGPWLEGTGSRNRTTRFKGYRTFATIVKQLDAKATQVANMAVQRFVGRMS